ncbi:MAG: hypothetical protein ABIG61_01660 [Planctomycetota bacterium]
MFGRKTDPVRRRNSLLMLAGVFLIIAVINKPSLLLFFASAKQFISLALMVFAALLAAIGVYNFAISIFGRSELPWYTKPWAMLFLIAALLVINAALMFAGNMLSNMFKTNLFFVQDSYIYVFMAFEVLWLVLLEWVSYKK